MSIVEDKRYLAATASACRTASPLAVGTSNTRERIEICLYMAKYE